MLWRNIMNPATPNYAPERNRIREKRIALLAVAFLAAGAAAAAVWVFWPAPKLVARARLQLAVGHDDAAQFHRFRHSQARLIKSRTVLNAALKQHEVKSLRFLKEESDPVARLEKDIKVDFSDGEHALGISLEGRQPKTQEVLVNAILNVYLNEAADREYNQRQQRLKQVEALFKTYDERVTVKRAQLEELTKAVGTSTNGVIKAQEKMTTKSVDNAVQELVQLRSEVRKLQARILVDREEKEPRTRLAALLYALPNFGAPLNLTLAPLLQSARLETPDDLRGVHKNLAYLQQLQKLLTEDIFDFTKEKNELGRSSLNLEYIRDDIARWQLITNKLSQERDKLDMEQQDLPRVTLFEEAVISRVEDDGSRMWMSCVAGLGTLVLILLVSAWWRY
jgi:hypothetical protein